MDEVLEYIRECGVCVLASAAGGAPHAAPLTGVCAFEGHLYVRVDKHSAEYRYLKEDPAAEICALHPDKSWIRVTGCLTEDSSAGALRAMEESCRDTLSDFPAAAGGAMAVFRLGPARAEVHELIGTRREWRME